MKCPKCGSDWLEYRNLGGINAYLYCSDCGREVYPHVDEKEDEADEV